VDGHAGVSAGRERASRSDLGDDDIALGAGDGLIAGALVARYDDEAARIDAGEFVDGSGELDDHVTAERPERAGCFRAGRSAH
jgi:hypothetical protein